MRYVFLLLFLPALAYGQAQATVCIIGDSQSKGVPGARPLYWEYLNTSKAGTRFAAVGLGSGGLRCDQIRDANFADNVLTGTTLHGCTRVVIQCGVNDLMQSRTSAQICGTSGSPGPIRQMVTAATARGIPVTLVNVAPWSAHSQWTAGKQTETVAVNACIASLASSLVTVIDAYTLLGQPGTPTALNTTYDDVAGGPDGLHYDTEGHQVLAGAAPF